MSGGVGSMKYAVITEDDVLELLVNAHLSYDNQTSSLVNLVNMAKLLKTSRYQVKKHIESLRKQNIVELGYHYVRCEEELYPPYWGYRVTSAFRDTEYFNKEEKDYNEWMDGIFEGLSV